MPVKMGKEFKFFVKFQKNLAEGGAIITDNLSFHGMVENQALTHNYSTIKMVRKIARYVTPRCTHRMGRFGPH